MLLSSLVIHVIFLCPVLFIFHDYSLWLSVILYFSAFLSLSSSSCVWCKQSSDFSDIIESAADYFSRSNRRGSIVSDLDDLSIPDLDAVSG